MAGLIALRGGCALLRAVVRMLLAQVHARVVGRTLATRRADVRRRAFGHVLLHSETTSGHFGRDALDAGSDTLLDSLGDRSIERRAALLFLALLGLDHLVDRVLWRDDLLAWHADGC